MRWLARGVAIWWLATGAATAHPDVKVADGSIQLEPGAATTLRMALHYHRLVGHAAATGGAASDVTLLVLDEDAWARYGDAAPVDEATFALRGLHDARLNTLIRCCDDSAYTDFRLVVRNDGAVPVDVALRAWAVHDDFAVVVDRAEAGAFAFPFAIFLGLSLAAGWSVLRRRDAGAPPGRRPVPRAFWWSLGLACAAGATALVLGTVGAVRYGAGPVDGMIAVMADLPIPGGPYGSRDALVMGILLLAWSAAIGFWIHAARRSGHGSTRPVGWLGVAIGATSLLAGALLGWTYGSYGVSVTLGIVLGLPLVALGGWLLRSGARRNRTAAVR